MRKFIFEGREHYSHFTYIAKLDKQKERRIFTLGSDTDHYVKKALKTFDGELYMSCWHQTRAGRVSNLQKRLDGYDKKQWYAPRGNLDVWNHAFKLAKTDFKLDELVPMRWIEDVELKMDKGSGFPFFDKKGKHLPEIFKEARMNFHYMKRYDFKDINLPPVTFAMRGSLSTMDEAKTRLVWAFPASMTVIEGVYAQNLVSAYSKTKKDLLMTGKYGKSRLRTIAAKLSGKTRAIGLDMSSFDTVTCIWLIERAFDILADNIDFSCYWDGKDDYQYGRSGVIKRAKFAFEQVKNYFIHTPFMIRDGEIYRKHCGVPSGSFFTNLIDSIITRILCRAIETRYRLRFDTLLVNGDDSVFTLKNNQNIDLDEIAHFLKTEVDMDLNVEKSCNTKKQSELHMSGTTWKGGLPYRPTQEWFSLALYCKHNVKDATQSFQRLLGLYVTGASRDRKFCRFFEFFQSGWKIDWHTTDYRYLDWMLEAFNITREDMMMVNDRNRRIKSLLDYVYLLIK